MVALEEKKFLNATNQAIMCGWKASIEDVRNFTNDVPKVAAEYLFTVNIAKSLSGKILSSDGDPYRIYLEHNAYQFLKDSFPSHKVERSGHPLGKGDRRVGRKIMLPRGFRKGRVDIAVYSTYPQSTNLGEFSPFCAIEIKGFNPQKNSILEDLRRNMEYFKTTASSGSSTIRYSIFAGLFGRSHSIRKELSDTDYQYECIQVKKKVEGYLQQLSRPSNIHICIECQSVSIDQHGTPYLEGDDYAIDLKTRHHIMGFTVRFESASMQTTA